LISFEWPRVFGFDFSGTVEEVGRNASGFQKGDEVFGMIAGIPEFHRGCCAEYVVVDAEVCAVKPKSVSHQEAAAVPLVSITAVMMLEACGLKMNPSSSPQGPRVLVLGGAGGVGSVAIQLAKCLFGASFVATTASAGRKTKLCKSLGADRVVDYRSTKFERALASDKQSDLFDAVLDCTGEASKCPSLLRKGGGLCSINGTDDVSAVVEWVQNPHVKRHFDHRITFGVRCFLSSYLGGGAFNIVSGARSVRRACEARGGTFRSIIGTGDGRIMKQIARVLGSGSFRAVIDRTYPLRDICKAIAYQRKGRAAGKVVISVMPSGKDNEDEDGASRKEGS